MQGALGHVDAIEFDELLRVVISKYTLMKPTVTAISSTLAFMWSLSLMIGEYLPRAIRPREWLKQLVSQQTWSYLIYWVPRKWGDFFDVFTLSLFAILLAGICTYLVLRCCSTRCSCCTHRQLRDGVRRLCQCC